MTALSIEALFSFTICLFAAAACGGHLANGEATDSGGRTGSHGYEASDAGPTQDAGSADDGSAPMDFGSIDANADSSSLGAGPDSFAFDTGANSLAFDTGADSSSLDAAGGTDAGRASGRGGVVGGYYPNWAPSPVRIRDVDSHYTLIYLFAAKPVGGAPGTTGAIQWSPPGDGRGAATNFNADIAYARHVQGRTILLSVGGAGAGMSFPTRTKSQTFLDSVSALYTQLGGFDGLDWNTFEGNQTPDTTEMIWISLQLKSRYPGFVITAPPAPWNGVDKAFCTQMVTARALDYAAPQYYDGPNLATQAYMMTSVDEWAALLGESHVVVGFGVWNMPNYMAIDQAVTAWSALKAKHPNLRGAFDWQIHVDEGQGWSFAKQVGPLVNQ